MATIVAHYSGESGIFKGLDVAKFIIALLVMEAHLQATGVLPEAFRETFIAPLLAIPVPLFFVFSSFFLFKKTAHLRPPVAADGAIFEAHRGALWLLDSGLVALSPCEENALFPKP